MIFRPDESLAFSGNNYEGVGACSDPETVPSATHTQTHPTGGSGRRDGCAPSIDGKVTVTEKQLIAPMLEAGGYHTMVTGKTDWAAGGHSLTTMVDSWSIYARFPYSIPENGGWHIWGDCGGNLTVAPKSAETEIPGAIFYRFSIFPWIFLRVLH